ncbi:hypothetical protein BDV12DRAFT_208062 [Aspergillus spectabilis]
MARPSQPVESYDRLSASDASSDLSDIFSDDGSDSDSSTDPGLDSEDSDEEDEPGDDTFDDEGQLSPEHYLAQAECLDVSQLRQKRYSDGTQERLDKTRMYWNRYCQHIGVDPVRHWRWISDSDETVRFLYAFFGWRCDICRGKSGRYCPGIAYKSSLESFWKWWHLILKQETASGLSKDIIIKVNDVIAMVAKEKGLKINQKPKKNMYIEDVAEFAHVLLTTTEMMFECGWQRIQLLFFCQLAAITASHPEGERPRLFIYLKPDFTKRFLGKKATNEFKIPEIIFDPTLVLSPYICLLSMLFHIQGFKRISSTGLVLDCPEKLYSLKILNGKGQKSLTDSTVRSRMRRGGEITGFDQITRPYLLRYAGAKEFNKSDVDVDVQGIIRKTGSQSPLLSPEESRSLNELPVVRARQDILKKHKQEWDDRKTKFDCAHMAFQATFSHLVKGALSKKHCCLKAKLELYQDQIIEAKRRYNKAICELRNEKQRQSGKLVDTKVMDALEHKGFMPPQHLIMINAMLTMPGATIEAELQRRINAINAMAAFCPVEEGRPMPRNIQSCRWPVPDDNEPDPPAKRQRHISEDTEVALYQVMKSVRVKSRKQRPMIYFLCLGNPNLLLKDRIANHKTPGSLTRHFLRKLPSLGQARRCCAVCGLRSESSTSPVDNIIPTLDLL